MTPDLRLTIGPGGTVRAICWNPGLATWGLASTLLEMRDRAGVTIADAAILREDEDDPVEELSVDFLCGGGAAAVDALLDWAALVGYGRVWLPGEVRDLPEPHEEKVETRCTGCRQRFVERGEDFWTWVRHQGFFPTMCVLCGSDLPQWTPVGRRAGRRRAPAVAGRPPAEVVDLSAAERRAR